MRETFRSRCWIVMIVVAASVCSARAESVGCKALHGLVVPASWIGLPTTGAEVSSAKRRHEGGVAYCRVMGKIHPVDPQADDIRFELNLPEVWNSKALQYGGGTFDGYIGKSDGLGRTAVGLKSQATPLTRGSSAASTGAPSGISCVRHGASRPSRSTIRSTASLAMRRQVVSFPPVMVMRPLEVSYSSALREMSTDLRLSRLEMSGRTPA